MALRSLPFWPSRSADDIDVAVELALDDPQRGMPLRRPSGEPTGEFAAIVTLVERLRLGIRRLEGAAKLLVAADILTPLWCERVATGYLTVSPVKLASLSPERAAALTMDRSLPLDLAVTCAFSQRHLAKGVRPSPDASEPSAQGVRRPAAAIDDPFDPSMRVDMSPLFSFELFEHLETRVPSDA